MANPRNLPIFVAVETEEVGGTIESTRIGTRLDWMQMMEAVMWADVVIIGEQHDDAIGHAVQRAVMDDAGARCEPPGGCALSMEMLERDDQDLADDYLDGLIDAKTFAKQTFSESWAGEGSWEKWYQPIIDAAKDHGGRVIAANAPRRYVRLARTEGYERLKEIPQPRRSLFDLPVKADDAAYRQRFYEFMSEGADATTQPASQPASQPESQPAATSPSESTSLSAAQPATRPATQPASQPATQAASQPSTAPALQPGSQPASQPATTAPASQPATTLPASQPSGHGSGPPTKAQMDASFRSQSVWDATMAASIVDARRGGTKKVIHLIGQFHCDFHGGTVAQLKARWPSVKLLVISMQREEGTSFREEDRGRADVVIYTGPRPPEAEETPDTVPTSAPAMQPTSS